jgi:hypothetical protein
MTMTKRVLTYVNDNIRWSGGRWAISREPSPLGVASTTRRPDLVARCSHVKRKPDLAITSNRQGTGVESPVRRRRTPAWSIAYFLISGTVSVMVGAAVSLAASGMGRLVLWSVATGVVAVSAGIAYESRLFRAGVRRFCR